ncbi:MAG TPA: hypothetical protein VGE15_13735 [Sphingobacteriaceae bacterium]
MQQFQGSLVANLHYPDFLTERCMATCTVLKIDIDAKGKVQGLTLSDSADPTFNMEFIFIAGKLDKEPLERLAELRQLKSATLFMPIYYSVTTSKCTSAVIDPLRLTDLYRFNKEHHRSTAMILPTLLKRIWVDSIR